MKMLPENDTEAITLIIEGLVKAGCTLVHVNNGDEDEPVTSTADAVEESTAADEATLVVELPTGERGWIWFVLGNSPEEVVCDHTVNLSTLIDPIVTPWW